VIHSGDYSGRDGVYCHNNKMMKKVIMKKEMVLVFNRMELHSSFEEHIEK
jgi:hypothetical protein